MEMTVDALNLFLIKEKALVCVRDELLEREWGGGAGEGIGGLGGSQSQDPAQQGGGVCSSP